jgi:hypothetical protein
MAIAIRWLEAFGLATVAILFAGLLGYARISGERLLWRQRGFAPPLRSGVWIVVACSGLVIAAMIATA